MDLLISLPKDYLRSIIFNGFVGIAIIVYSNKYMQTAVGKEQASTVVLSIIIRLAVNTLNNFLLTPGSSAEQRSVLVLLIKWNGYFAIALSALM